jgi:hypothetical protein
MGFDRIERQRKPLQPFVHRVQKALGIVATLAADDKIVGIPHTKHITSGFTLSLALGPEVEGVVQLDIGQEWRDHPALSPLSLPTTTPSSRTLAMSRFRVRRMTRASPIWCSTNLISHFWLRCPAPRLNTFRQFSTSTSPTRSVSRRSRCGAARGRAAWSDLLPAGTGAPDRNDEADLQKAISLGSDLQTDRALYPASRAHDLIKKD